MYKSPYLARQQVQNPQTGLVRKNSHQRHPHSVPHNSSVKQDYKWGATAPSPKIVHVENKHTSQEAHHHKVTSSMSPRRILSPHPLTEILEEKRRVGHTANADRPNFEQYVKEQSKLAHIPFPMIDRKGSTSSSKEPSSAAHREVVKLPDVEKPPLHSMS